MAIRMTKDHHQKMLFLWPTVLWKAHQALFRCWAVKSWCGRSQR